VSVVAGQKFPEKWEPWFCCVSPRRGLAAGVVLPRSLAAVNSDERTLKGAGAGGRLGGGQRCRALSGEPSVRASSAASPGGAGPVSGRRTGHRWESTRTLIIVEILGEKTDKIHYVNYITVYAALNYHGAAAAGTVRLWISTQTTRETSSS
jgi:hypothetical protein